MRFLFVTDGITPFIIGGMQKHSAGLIASLNRLGHEITLVHCIKSGMQKPDQEEVCAKLGIVFPEKLHTICLYFPNAGIMPGHYLRASYLYSRKVFELVEKNLSAYDFIYTKGFTGWHFIERKLKGKTEIPPIGVKFHGYEMFQPGGSLKMRFQKYMLRGPVEWISRNADAVFSYGSKITDVILSIGVKRERIIEIPTGIDEAWLSDMKKPDPDRRRFIFVGRYERRKGIEELQEVISSLAVPAHVEFHFVGPIPPSKRLKGNNTFYHGEVRDKNVMVKLLDAADVLICPSHSEGMPNVIMEAMARGLAVIATDVGAVGVMVSDEVGRLIPPLEKDALRKAIEQMMEMPDKDLRFRGNRAREMVKERFLWDEIGTETIEKLNRYLGIA